MLNRSICGVSVLVILAAVGCQPRTDANVPVEVQLSADDQLLTALNQGDVEAASDALRQGADPNYVHKMSDAANDEFSLLQRAVSRGNLEMARVLLANDADVNLAAGGTTPLHNAITSLKFPSGEIDRTEQIEMITLFLDSGADANALDRLDRTPVDLADGDEELVALLKSRGGLSTVEMQEQELENIESQGGGLIGSIPDSVEELKRREAELGRKNGVETNEEDPVDPPTNFDDGGIDDRGEDSP